MFVILKSALTQTLSQEDVDLLSFSDLLANRTQLNRNAQGLPLKAVHRGPIVGIRYQHPIVSQPHISPVRFLLSLSKSAER